MGTDGYKIQPPMFEEFSANMRSSGLYLRGEKNHRQRGTSADLHLNVRKGSQERRAGFTESCTPQNSNWDMNWIIREGVGLEPR